MVWIFAASKRIGNRCIGIVDPITFPCFRNKCSREKVAISQIRREVSINLPVQLESAQITAKTRARSPMPAETTAQRDPAR